MIITFMIISVVLLGIVLLVISQKCNLSWDMQNNLSFAGEMTIILSVIATVICFTIILYNVTMCDINYQNMLYAKEMLEHRIEHMDEDVIGNEMLYNDIVEFNNELRIVKKFANSPWTNWFNNQKIADLDYVVFENDE